MVIMGIDPSFKALSFSIYDGKGTVYIDKISFPLGEYMGFDRIFEAVRAQWQEFTKRVDEICDEHNISIDKVISEIPPPVGQFSAGLFALDTYILSNLFDKYESIKEIYVVSPSYLGTVHGTAKYQKSDSTKLAKYFINEVLSDKISVSIPDNISDKGRRTKGTLNNDRAESFLFLLRMFCKEDVLGCRDIIANEMMGLNHEAEKLLLKR